MGIHMSFLGVKGTENNLFGPVFGFWSQLAWVALGFVQKIMGFKNHGFHGESRNCPLPWLRILDEENNRRKIEECLETNSPPQIILKIKSTFKPGEDLSCFLLTVFCRNRDDIWVVQSTPEWGTISKRMFGMLAATSPNRSSKSYPKCHLAVV